MRHNHICPILNILAETDAKSKLTVQANPEKSFWNALSDEDWGKANNLLKKKPDIISIHQHRGKLIPALLKEVERKDVLSWRKLVSTLSAMGLDWQTPLQKDGYPAFCHSYQHGTDYREVAFLLSKIKEPVWRANHSSLQLLSLQKSFSSIHNWHEGGLLKLGRPKIKQWCNDDFFFFTKVLPYATFSEFYDKRIFREISQVASATELKKGSINNMENSATLATCVIDGLLSAGYPKSEIRLELASLNCNNPFLFANLMERGIEPSASQFDDAWRFLCHSAGGDPDPIDSLGLSAIEQMSVLPLKAFKRCLDAGVMPKDFGKMLGSSSNTYLAYTAFNSENPFWVKGLLDLGVKMEEADIVEYANEKIKSEKGANKGCRFIWQEIKLRILSQSTISFQKHKV